MKRVCQLSFTVAAILGLLLGFPHSEAQAHSARATDVSGGFFVVGIIGHGLDDRDGKYQIKITANTGRCGVAHYASASSGGTKAVPNSTVCNGTHTLTFQAGPAGDHSLFFNVCEAGKPATCGDPIAFIDH
jgi:hypothetical protein